MGELSAVLFDMDGTIVDTEPYWIAAEHRLVESYGGTWSETHAHALVGSALETTGAYIHENTPVSLAPDQIVETLINEVTDATLTHIPWRPGARELLAQLRTAGIPCALVTMSYAGLAAAVVEQLPPGTFGAVVTGDQVADGKPHPEAYLTACERLGVSPAHTIAIEDSPTGVASAFTAGCRTVAVPHQVRFAPPAGVVVLDSLTDVSLDQLAALFDGAGVTRDGD